MRWILPEVDETKAAHIAGALSLHPIAARILVARGLSTPEEASELLRAGLGDLPDPSRMKGVDEAARRLARAVASAEKITLWGDYDVDGVTSTALLARFLTDIGGVVATYIPLRLGEGYGLNPEAIERIASDGTRLLVALDCGITALAEIERARALGLDVIVVDHHQLGASLPNATAIIDPQQPGCAYPSKDLCAAGLAFLVAVALRRTLREAGHFRGRAEPNLRSYLDLVALGTIADVVPLRGVNRILVKHGLVELVRSERPGVRALKAVSGVYGSSLTAGQVAFRLAPRLNAAGRLANAAAGVELLTTCDPIRAESLARALDVANVERQAIEKRILDEALKQAEAFPDARSLVLAAESWHAGVVGIVASRMVERFHRPAFIIAVDGVTAKGSGRSIEGFHIHQALVRCAEHLTRFGGHRHAAGISLPASAVPAFRDAFEAEARAALGDAPLEGRCRIDAVVSLREINASLAEALASLAPFGAGNAEPVLATFGLRAQPRIVPAKNGGAGHLKLSVAGAAQLDVIGFGLAERASLASSGTLDAAFHVGIDEYQGQPRVALKLRDVRASVATV